MEVGVTGFVIGVIVEAIERWHSGMIYWQVEKRLQNTRTSPAWERNSVSNLNMLGEWVMC